MLCCFVRFVKLFGVMGRFIIVDVWDGNFLLFCGVFGYIGCCCVSFFWWGVVELMECLWCLWWGCFGVGIMLFCVL